MVSLKFISPDCFGKIKFIYFSCSAWDNFLINNLTFSSFQYFFKDLFVPSIICLKSYSLIRVINKFANGICDSVWRELDVFLCRFS